MFLLYTCLFKCVLTFAFTVEFDFLLLKRLWFGSMWFLLFGCLDLFAAGCLFLAVVDAWYLWCSSVLAFVLVVWYLVA